MSYKQDGAPNAINSGQVSVGMTATLIVAANPSRRKLWLNGGCRIGPSGVSTSTGFDITSTPNGYFELETAAEVWGVVGSGSVTLSYLEFFDN